MILLLKGINLRCVWGPEREVGGTLGPGVVAPGSQHLALATVPISLNALKVLRHMQRSSYEQVASLSIRPNLHADLERIMLGYIQYTLENRLQSVDFIQRLRRMISSP